MSNYDTMRQANHEAWQMLLQAEDKLGEHDGRVSALYRRRIATANIRLEHNRERALQALGRKAVLLAVVLNAEAAARFAASRVQLTAVPPSRRLG